MLPRHGATRRWLAILPQPPAFTKADMKLELKLQKRAELAASQQRAAIREAAISPRFDRAKRPKGLLRLYASQRDRLTPRDAVGAFYALSKLARGAAHRLGRSPLANPAFGAAQARAVPLAGPGMYEVQRDRRGTMADVSTRTRTYWDLPAP